MLKTETEKPIMNTIFFARSIDAYQKAHGNIVAIVKLTQVIIDQLSKNLDKEIKIGSLAGFISDAHIYTECWEDANKTIQKYEASKY